MSLFKKSADDILALFEKLTDEEKEAVRKKLGGGEKEETAPATDAETEAVPENAEEEDPHAEGEEAPATEDTAEAEENGEGASETAAETAEEGAEEAEAEADGTTAEAEAEETGEEASPEPEAVPAGNVMSREEFAKEIESLNAKYDAKFAEIVALAQKGADLADRLNAEEAKAEDAIGYQRVGQGEPSQRETYAELRKRTIGF